MRTKAAFITLLFLTEVKKKNPQTSANVTHKLQGQGQTSESYGVLHRICAGKRGDRSTSAWRMGNCKTDGASISTTDF